MPPAFARAGITTLCRAREKGNCAGRLYVVVAAGDVCSQRFNVVHFWFSSCLSLLRAKRTGWKRNTEGAARDPALPRGKELRGPCQRQAGTQASSTAPEIPSSRDDTHWKQVSSSSSSRKSRTLLGSRPPPPAPRGAGASCLRARFYPSSDR